MSLGKKNISSNFEKSFLEKYVQESHVNWTNVRVRGSSLRWDRIEKDENFRKNRENFFEGLIRQNKAKVLNQKFFFKYLGNQAWSNQMQLIITIYIHPAWMISNLWNSKVKKILIMVCGTQDQGKLKGKFWRARSWEVIIKHSWELDHWSHNLLF